MPSSVKRSPVATKTKVAATSKSNPWVKWSSRATIAVVLYLICYILDGIKEQFYIFDKSHLHELAKEAIAIDSSNMTVIVDHIVTGLSERYGKTINAEWRNPDEWMLNNAGGAMGGMVILHASITEYLIIFGTPLGTEGHTGRHTADDYFHILFGEQWAYTPGSFDQEIYKAGDVHHLRRGDVKQYKMHEGCWAMELAQGWIPLMLPFGFADGLTSTLDVPTLWKTTYLTGREIIKNLLNFKI